MCVCVLAGFAFCTSFCFVWCRLVRVCVFFVLLLCFDLVCVCVLAGSAFCMLFCFGVGCGEAKC